MRHPVFLLALAFLLQRRDAQRPERLFYYVDRETSYESFAANIDQIDIVGPQVYRVDSLGIVWGSLDPRVKRLAAKHVVNVMPPLVNEGFRQASLRRLLADTAARDRATQSLVRLCRDEGYWGIQFDVENVNIQDKDLFTSWYSEAAAALHGAGCTINERRGSCDRRCGIPRTGRAEAGLPAGHPLATPATRLTKPDSLIAIPARDRIPRNERRRK